MLEWNTHGMGVRLHAWKGHRNRKRSDEKDVDRREVQNLATSLNTCSKEIHALEETQVETWLRICLGMRTSFIFRDCWHTRASNL
jgi:hypothetical protein